MSTTHFGYPEETPRNQSVTDAATDAADALASADNKIEQLKPKVEAVLFLTAKALSLAEIAEHLKAPYADVELAMIELMGDFAMRESSALEIDDTDGYILQVKEACADVVHAMMPLEISAAELRTLSAIAIKAPVLQSALIEWRGSSAYDHIATLLGHKLISKKRQGRSYQLTVTRHFHEYFKLTADKKSLATLVELSGTEHQ
ncbi:MAG: SMC-Scp complex subunit ScpB [Cyanobacteria bacterium P01_H01_bin.74]